MILHESILKKLDLCLINHFHHLFLTAFFIINFRWLDNHQSERSFNIELKYSWLVDLRLILVLILLQQVFLNVSPITVKLSKFSLIFYFGRPKKILREIPLIFVDFKLKKEFIVNLKECLILISINFINCVSTQSIIALIYLYA